MENCTSKSIYSAWLVHLFHSAQHSRKKDFFHFKLNISSIIENHESGYRVAGRSPSMIFFLPSTNTTFPFTTFFLLLSESSKKMFRCERTEEKLFNFFFFNFNFLVMSRYVVLLLMLSFAFDEPKLIFKQVLTSLLPRSFPLRLPSFYLWHFFFFSFFRQKEIK